MSDIKNNKEHILRTLRLDSRLSLNEVSRKTGIHPATLSRIERDISPISPTWARELLRFYKGIGVAAQLTELDILYSREAG